MAAAPPTLELHHAKDGMRCTLSASVAEPYTSTPEVLRGRICELGIPQDLVLLDALRPIIDAFSRGESVQDVLVARGRPAEHGYDAQLYLEVLDQSTVEADSREAIDHRDQGRPAFVSAGQRLGTLTLDTPGRPGLTTKGEMLPSKPGIPLDVTLGEGITVGGDGIVSAAFDGFVLLIAGTLSLLKELRIKGDVDYTTGHVLLERGDVEVEGSVLPGFRIETSGNIVIKGDVEAARLSAGGHISINGIIVDGAGCVVRAGGDVSCARIVGATVSCGGNLEVRSEMLESTAEVGGVLAVAGRLVGGHAIAAGGAEIGVLGGRAYTATVLQVGRNSREAHRVTQRIDELEAGIGRLERLLTSKAASESLKRRLDTLGTERAQQQALLAGMQAGLGTAHVVVKKTLYPGVRIEVDGQSTSVDHPTPACTVRRGDDGSAEVVPGRRAA